MRRSLFIFAAAVVCTNAMGATVFRVLPKSQRAILKLTDDEIMRVTEGDLLSFKSLDGQLVAGKVVKVTENRAMVKVKNGFASIKSNGRLTLLAQNGADQAVARTTPPSVPAAEFELGTTSPSPFAHEFFSGTDEAAFIARVPTNQAGLEYNQIVQGGGSVKNDDANIDNELSKVGGNGFEANGVMHLTEKFWVGATIARSESNIQIKDKETDTKTDFDDKGQQITLKLAFLINEKWVLGANLDSISIESEISGSGDSLDDSASYNRVRPSLAYYGQQYELVLSHRPTINISEGAVNEESPAQLKAEFEMYMSSTLSLGGSLAYVWYNRVDKNYKNSFVPTFEMTQRLSTGRFVGGLAYDHDHYRDDGEDLTSVRSVSLGLAYFHMFSPNFEALGGLIYDDIAGGDDTKLKANALTATVGINYKG